MPPLDLKASSDARPMEVPTKVLTGFLLFVLGIVILLLLVLITLATAITKSAWWSRRKRLCQRRLDNLGSSKPLPWTDKMFYIANICLEAIAFQWDDDETTSLNKTTLKSKSIEPVEVDGQHIPLRFQPEKLYGTTSTVHRDNMRKRSFSTLGVKSSADNQRRSSMIDSLSFLNPSNCFKSTKSSTEQNSTLPSYKMTYPQLDEPSARWNPSTLPQIDVTCAQDGPDVADDEDLIDGARSDREAEEGCALSVSIPVRRASTANIKVIEPILNRRASCADVSTTSSTLQPANQIEADQALNVNELTEVTQTLKPVQTCVIKRNSLVEGLSSYRNIPLKADNPLSLTDDEVSATRSSLTKDSSLGIDISDRKLSLTVADSPVKIPYPPANKTSESPAGYLALSITSIEEKSTDSETLVISFLTAKLLKSPRPWQKGNFSLRTTYRSLNHVQQATLVCKHGELGRLRFSPQAQLKFDMCDREKKRHPTTMNQLKITIVEGGSKWTTEKEYCHGTVSIQIPGFQVLTGKPEWYAISTAYPVIRIKADLLVSLCQLVAEGSISVGVHEIRNVDLQKKAPYSMSAFDQLTNVEQSGFEIHACLTYDGHLIKSKKSVFLQQARHMQYMEKPQPSMEKRRSLTTRHRMSFSRTVSGEHYLQFSLPNTKKNLGRMSVANYGIVLFVTHKLTLTDPLPEDFSNQLKLMGVPEPKSLQAVGECFISDEISQSAYWKKVSFEGKCDVQCASLWNEASNHECSRVYQWLTTG